MSIDKYMEFSFLIAVALSLIVSAFMIPKVVRSQGGVVQKLFLCVLIFVPILGPVMGLVILDLPPPQSPNLKNNLPRGWYADRWISWMLSQRNSSEDSPVGEDIKK